MGCKAVSPQDCPGSGGGRVRTAFCRTQRRARRGGCISSMWMRPEHSGCVEGLHRLELFLMYATFLEDGDTKA